ncbi:DMT family transporter [Actinomadura parmotrematis]|uniref:DMT family transporter n=1 Tax=Actinomadura parmotrematis TaxID=2864039 RepID=A0ABS7FW23_9ACTN|nr:DMT family transporter [Actinomadura parmotrematis]MBW8483638.1 DMT family transporter [Actinomadura parmotrematis]
MKDKSSAIPGPAVARSGLVLAFLGVLTFSFTIIASVYALRGLDPYLIGIGRAAAVTVPAALALAAARAPRPRGAEWPALLVAGAGVVFGFPVLSTLALDHGASASHSAVVIGLLPAATAVLAVLRAGERPSRAFWAAAAAGAVCVTGFALLRGAGRLSAADLLLLGALLAAAAGYAEGGRVARARPGWQVISWALVLSAPITLPVTAWLLATTSPHWTPQATAGFAYVALMSAFLGFFAWYEGLARAGIARASQVQLTQPPLTLAWSALLLGEHVDLLTGAAALAVLGCVAAAQRARVGAAPAPVPAVSPGRSARAA